MRATLILTAAFLLLGAMLMTRSAEAVEPVAERSPGVAQASDIVQVGTACWACRPRVTYYSYRPLTRRAYRWHGGCCPRYSYRAYYPYYGAYSPSYQTYYSSYYVPYPTFYRGPTMYWSY